MVLDHSELILVDAKRLYPAVISPEAGLAKIILAKIKEQGAELSACLGNGLPVTGGVFI